MVTIIIEAIDAVTGAGAEISGDPALDFASEEDGVDEKANETQGNEGVDGGGDEGIVTPIFRISKCSLTGSDVIRGVNY